MADDEVVEGEVADTGCCRFNDVTDGGGMRCVM